MKFHLNIKGIKTYCLVCKKTADNANTNIVKVKGRLMQKSLCTICGKKKRFISQGSGLKL